MSDDNCPYDGNVVSPKGIIVDSDIVGPGVLVAFLLTTVLTIFAVVYAYMSGSLEDQQLNELDRRIIIWIQQRFNRLLSIFYFKKQCAVISDGIAAHPDIIAPRAQRETIQQFVLALSDQQLVSGLAILAAGIASLPKLSIYEFAIVACLAWFSSTTHLATLDVLRPYLRSHPGTREIRVLAMGLVLALLTYAGIITGRTFPVYGAFTGKCALEIPTSSLIIYNAFPWAVALPLIICAYLGRIHSLYFDVGPVSFPWALSLYSRLPKQAASKRPPLHILDAEMRASCRRADLLLLVEAQRRRRRPLWLPLATALYNYQGSFMSSFSSLTFSFVYGLSQLIIFRWFAKPDTTPESDYIGFGQMVALFMLALPFLAAGEAYFNYSGDSTSKKPNSRGQAQGGNNQIPEATHHVPPNTPVIERQGLDQLTSIAAREYEEHLFAIKRFFPADSWLLEVAQSQQDVYPTAERHDRIMQKKLGVVAEFARLRNMERDLRKRPAVIYCFAKLTLNTLLAAGLNFAGVGAALQSRQQYIPLAILGVMIPFVVDLAYAVRLAVQWTLFVAHGRKIWPASEKDDWQRSTDGRRGTIASAEDEELLRDGQQASQAGAESSRDISRETTDA